MDNPRQSNVQTKALDAGVAQSVEGQIENASTSQRKN